MFHKDMPQDSEYECGLCKEPGDALYDSIAYVYCKREGCLVNVHPECAQNLERAKNG